MSATCRSDFRLDAQQGFEPGDDIGHLTYSLLQLPLDLFNGTGVQAGAGHLGKVAAPRRAVGMIFRARQVDAGFAALANYGPRGFQLGGDSQLAGEDVHRPERQDTQARALEAIRHVAYSVDDFVERAVAASSDNGVKTLTNRFGGEAARIPHS